MSSWKALIQPGPVWTGVVDYADTRITDELQQALALVDVRLLDHFVVGEGRPVSFAERGLLSPPQPRLFG